MHPILLVLSFFLLLFSFVSCCDDDGDEVKSTPVVLVKTGALVGMVVSEVCTCSDAFLLFKVLVSRTTFAEREEEEAKVRVF